jgi:exosome complex RNA-binding protein Csl4
MFSDESALLGYCTNCKKLFEVKWAENVCPECETINKGKDNEEDCNTGADV